jgi:ABC-type antimicrobial peptide transport system permease subunit
VFRWWNDLVLGVRLAVSGGRAGWGRLALTAIGVGMGVAVLLAATSVNHMMQSRDDRGYARAVASGVSGSSTTAVDPVYVAQRNSEFQGRDISGYVVQKTGPRPPLPPGVDRLPDVGEVVLSPALSDLLNSPAGELLRPRFTEHVVGVIGPAGLTGPNELFFYVGVPTVSAQSDVAKVYQFGRPSVPTELDGMLWLLIVLGSAAFLVPVVVFVATSSRLAAAARDRRLAALRLVGAHREQVRRIAAGEAFVGALAGILVGVGLFLFGRALVPGLSVTALRGGIFSEDIRPEWTLATLIVVAVPLLAVGIATLSLRRVIIEPLGVVRRARNQRRRLWWRLAPTVLGIGLLASQAGKLGGGIDGSAQIPVAAGIVLVLAAVPLMLPWIVERTVSMLGGGSPAWQLAVRRLQLDSGTSARVVAGVAVVLAGAIALQAVFALAVGQYQPSDVAPPQVSANLAATGLRQALALAPTLHQVRGATGISAAVTSQVRIGENAEIRLNVGSCDDLRGLAAIDQCHDGDIFFSTAKGFTLAAGQSATILSYQGASAPKTQPWTVPGSPRRVRALDGGSSDSDTIYATPGALAGITEPLFDANASLRSQTKDDNFVEYVRNALVPFGWSAYAFAPTVGVNGTFVMIGQVLVVGSVITLLFAAGSLLVVALEQIRERRRALAVLTANGVQRWVLARSQLWQAAVPIAVAVVVAVVTGLVLAGLLLTVTRRQIMFDWSTIALFVGTAVLAVLVSTGCTLPSLWRAASAEGLRGE